MDTSGNYDIPALRTQMTALLDDGESYPVQLELQFPRILVQVIAQWGKPELDAYLNELMLPARADRQGFPEAIAIEIFHLANVHARLNLSQAQTAAGWSGVDDPERDKKSLNREG
jgi:hypothetical protein